MKKDLATWRIFEAFSKNLEMLDLSNLGLTHIPSEISDLSKLKELKLAKNNLASVPVEITKLVNLTKLDLSDNKLTSLPKEIIRLSSLVELDLSNNRFRSFQGVINQRTGLYEESSSIDLGQFRRLKKLSFENNELISIPPELGSLLRLTTLNLAANKLTRLPLELFKLANLITLNLSNNQIQTLPDGIYLLTYLRSLFLHYNQLTTLPSKITELGRLRVLLLQGNKLDIPTEILGVLSSENREAQKILRFLKETQSNSLQQLNETKMLVVGQGGVGKTSIIKRLIDNEFNRYSGKTDGIDIHTKQLRFKSGRTIQLNIWDFGGQEVMHATHQFFLTQRSIYLFVLDSRIDRDANKPDYWLNLIEQHGGSEAPIVLVINKIDDNPILSLNEAALKRKFNIISILRTSCETGAGIKKLWHTIANTIIMLPHVSDMLPSTWFAVKQALEAEKKRLDIIPFNTFSSLCNNQNIDVQSRPILLRLLHDLGTVLNFYKDKGHPVLEETQILNPEWVTDGVYAVINSEDVFAEKGVLVKTNLKGILDQARYPSYGAREFILGMMIQFELAYPFDGGRRYLIPDLLPESEPDIFGFTDTLKFEYRYTNFIPPSVLSRFIVRQHEKIKNHENELWGNGVVIHFENMKALVRAEAPARKLTIAVQGDTNRCRELLAIIRDTLNAIHGSFAKLRVQAMVPIPNNEDVAVSHKALLAAERSGHSEIYVEDLDEYISVKPLLEGVDGPKSNRELRQLLEKLSLDDIKNALYDMKIDYELISDKDRGRSAYARETLLHLEKRGQVDIFLNEVKQSRPDLQSF